MLKECEFGPDVGGARAGLVDISRLNQKLRSVLSDTSTASALGQRDAIAAELKVGLLASSYSFLR